MTAHLTELASSATGLASLAWREGSENLDFTEHLEKVARDQGLPEINLAALRQVLEVAMTDFDDNRPGSDAWLSSRVHAVLRLTRREAARRGLWRHLAMVEFPDYVRWRFGRGSSKGGKDEAAKPERFHGEPTKHALGRLWWGAEQFRNGPDYGPVELAFTNQDLMNNLFRMDIAHHRPTVQAAVNVLFPDGDKPRGGDDANALAKAANLAATTLLIDALAPDEDPLDNLARTTWMNGDVDALQILDKVPAGPNDPTVPATSVAFMTDHLARLLVDAPSRRSRSRTGATEIDAETESRTGATTPST